MALTETQKAQIRTYLGYSDMSRQGFQDLEGVMLNLSAAAETIVGSLLTSLTTIDTSLADVSSANRAGIIEVDNGGVKWADGSSAGVAVAKQGRILVRRLSTILGIAPASDAFGSAVGGSGMVGRG